MQRSLLHTAAVASAFLCLCAIALAIYAGLQSCVYFKPFIASGKSFYISSAYSNLWVDITPSLTPAQRQANQQFTALETAIRLKEAPPQNSSSTSGSTGSGDRWLLAGTMTETLTLRLGPETFVETRRALWVDFRGIALAAALFPTGWLIWLCLPASLAQRRRAAGQCEHCGYDLRESPERCPECGNPSPPRGAVQPPMP